MASNPVLKRAAARSVRYDTVEAMIAALDPSYPVYCLRSSVLRERTRRFLDSFPGTVLYAVKCNPHPLVLRALYEEGIRHFDTASLPEIAQVHEMFPDATAYFHHPVKSRAVIVNAYEVYGVRHFVVDHIDELRKLVSETGARDLIIMVRMATPESGAAYNLSAKFGARPDEAVMLLKTADEEGYRTGLAFHVGSQCLNPAAFKIALDIANRVLDASGAKIDYLDVGGGFPAAYVGRETPLLEDYFAAIRTGLEPLKLPQGCEVLCEPGRTLVANGCTLVTQIHLRKGDSLYLNDGIYQSFSELVAGYIRLPARLLRPNGAPSERSMDFTIYGPTCDSLDVLPVPVHLPADAREGDWIEFGRIGAYSNAVSTRFNGFYTDTFVEIGDASWPPRNV